jgi:hypothetical protein
MTDFFDFLAAIARKDAERIRATWAAMSPEERAARQREEYCSWLIAGVWVPASEEHLRHDQMAEIQVGGISLARTSTAPPDASTKE